MAKKNKRKVKTTTPKRTLTGKRIEQTFDALTPAFIDWFEPDGSDPAVALGCLNAARFMVETCGELAAETSATSFPAWAVEQTVDAVLAAAEGDAAAAETVDASLEAWDIYLHFLDESGRWTGSDEDFDDVHAALSAADGTTLPEIEVPELSAAEQVEAFTALELVQRSMRLLDWIGSGKEVTQTGVLRLKDITAAAGCVGISVRPAGRGEPASDPLPGLDGPDAEDRTVPAVRSMHHVPLLSTIWTALQDAELISVSTTSVTTTSFMDELRHGDSDTRLAGYRTLVLAFLLRWMADDGGFGYLHPAATALVMSVLIAGTTDEPISKDRLAELDAEAPDDDVLAPIVGRLASRQLEQLTALGLLRPGPDYVVEPVVAQCVAALMDQATRFADGEWDDGWDDDPWEEDGFASPAVTSPGVTRTAESRVFQLKISLRGATPPIWRRVLVPSSIRLSELHWVIQRSFEWDNAHLHAFHSVRNRRTTSYAPADASLEESTDESTVALGDVLARKGSKMTYIYDFGDSWEHLIELEQTLDDDRRELPVCIDGKRAGPEEDSGGVWGWENLLATVNDPSAENHEEMRDWMAMEPGETLDGEKFDLEAVNRRLAVLR